MMEKPEPTKTEMVLFYVAFMGTVKGMPDMGYLSEVIRLLPPENKLEDVLFRRGPRDQEVRFYVPVESPNPSYEKELADYEIKLAEEEEKQAVINEIEELEKRLKELKSK